MFALILVFSLGYSAVAQTDEIIINKKKAKDSTQIIITKDGNQPLYLLDGKKIDNINAIAAEDIASVNVLKGKMATDAYGEKGANGVVVITSKKNEKRDSSKVTVIIDNAKNIQEKKDTNITMKVVVEGNKITINGKEVDENDPRLHKEGKDQRKIILKKLDTPSLIEDQEVDNFDWVKPEAPKTNQAFLGVITEANELGAKINQVSEQSPAAKAGLKEGDIITKVNDIKIDGPEALYDAIGKFKPDEKVTISYVSSGKKNSQVVSLAKNKNTTSNFNYNFNLPNGQIGPNEERKLQTQPRRFNFSIPHFPGMDDLSIAGIENKPKLGISIEDVENGEGVNITNVTENSPAAKSGLKENDIIVKVNDEKIKDVDDLKPIIKEAKEGANFTFQIKRNKEIKTIIVKLPKKLKTADL